MSHTYYIAEAFKIVKDHRKLDPAYCPVVGQWYVAMFWNENYMDYKAMATAKYLGDGKWIDDRLSGDPLDYSYQFSWCNYIVKQR